MLSPKLKSTLDLEIGARILNIQRAFGGDINTSYHLQTERKSYFVKTNRYEHGLDMFAKEAEGLVELNEKGGVRTPAVISFGSSENTHYLILQSILEGKKTDLSFRQLGHDLAKMHAVSNSRFGWKASNYIGPLPQVNLAANHWPDFYIHQRVQPLISDCISYDRLGAEYADLTSGMISWMESNIPKERPSLIHGDLWSGNVMYDQDGTPVFIDPAISYCSREMDIAMLQLFGGLHPSFLATYQSSFPLIDGWEERIPFYQLYYLLVHLRLFGSSYKKSVTRILDPFL